MMKKFFQMLDGFVANRRPNLEDVIFLSCERMISIVIYN